MKTATKIRRWGNSLGMRIPKNIALESDIGENEVVEMETFPGKIILSRAQKKKRPTIDELIARMTPETLNRDDEFLNAFPVGKEIW